MNNEFTIGNKPYVIQKGAVRVLSLRRELIDEILDPQTEIQEIKRRHIGADLLTFVQRPSAPSSQLPYYREWDNRAVLEIKTYDDWFKSQIPQQTRNKIRKAEKKGVMVQIEPFSEKLVEGLVGMFNESPTRQARPNRYYGWDSEMVRRVWETDLERSFWVVAYYGHEMIGFIKLIVGDGIARTSGTIAKIAHRDKGTMNAVLAKSVELCAEKKIPLLVYGQFTYGRKGEDTLTEFKIHNGFKRFDLPRWYVPLCLRGHIGLRLGLHRDLIDLVPGPMLRLIRKMKTKWYERLRGEAHA